MAIEQSFSDKYHAGSSNLRSSQNPVSEQPVQKRERVVANRCFELNIAGSDAE